MAQGMGLSRWEGNTPKGAMQSLQLLWQHKRRVWRVGTEWKWQNSKLFWASENTMQGKRTENSEAAFEWVGFFCNFCSATLWCITFLTDFLFFALKICIVFRSLFSEVNLKWKQTTHLANPALKLNIKNVSSDKYFQGKQTEEKLKNLCGA